MKGLFQKNDEINQIKIDMQLSSLEQSRCRDFTIGALFCNLDGEIIDPTGKGIEDAKKTTLRTIINPNLSFQEDSVRVLRAIKKMTRGFIPSPDLEDALHNWFPTDKTNKEHMLAVLNDHFKTENVIQYEENLKKYQVAEKLCDINILKKEYPLIEVKQEPVLFAYLISSKRKTKSLDNAVTIEKITDDLAYLNLSLS